ncbi:MAG: hypothetical protein QM768_16945 [Agriterribacter sp.]
MKVFLTSLYVILAIMQQAVAQSSWKSPAYKAESYRKVIVMAKISDDLARRQLEDASVKLLNEKGITAIPAYSNITETDLASEDAFIQKADALQADAVIVFNITGTGTEYKNKPSVDAYVGVPVRIGIFRASIGGNVPLAGGTKVVTVVNATAGFYNRSSKDLLWSTQLSGKLKKDTDKLAAAFAKATVNALLKDGMFLQNK